ncbi:hypothetical protein P3L10_017994 [Capsicum annuum]
MLKRGIVLALLNTSDHSSLQYYRLLCKKKKRKNLNSCDILSISGKEKNLNSCDILYQLQFLCANSLFVLVYSLPLIL